MHDKSRLRRIAMQSLASAGVLGLAVTGVALSLPTDAHLKAATISKQPQPGEGPVQPESDREIEASLYGRVMRLRDDIALTNDDLAAMGLTQAQAEDVLTRLLDWVETNQPAMIQADNALRDARRAVVALQRRIQTGEADEFEVQGFGDLYQAVADADAARKTIRHQAGAHAVAPAPESIRAQWAQAMDNTHLPADLRHVPGLDEQRLRAMLGNALNTQSVSSGSAGGGGVIEAGLTPSELDDRQEIRIAIQTNLPGVAAAEAQVLPAPTALGDGEDAMEWEDQAE